MKIALFSDIHANLPALRVGKQFEGQKYIVGEFLSIKSKIKKMKTIVRSPRILKIKSIDGFIISCIFNNGETRDIDFKKLFSKWKVTKDDPEFDLLNVNEFKKVSFYVRPGSYRRFSHASSNRM